MFESLLSGFGSVMDRLRGKGRITEANTREAMREIRTALLEADVNYKVAKDFAQAVQDRALGEDVIKSVSPGQQIIKIFHDELVSLMGPVSQEIPFQKKGVTVIMLAGLQGCGKTTTCAKLAHLLEKQGRRPLMVAADVQRPAAVEQLKTLGRQIGIEVFSEEGKRPPRICAHALKHAEKQGHDTVLLDTAGRLHVDEELMVELQQIAKKTNPSQTYFVCDALTGQDAVNSAQAFNERLEIDGVIMTKLDGDGRGGAALSVKAVTGKPIKFVGVGEDIEGLEPFYPDRMASRILGMGDVVSFVEKAQQAVDREEAEKLARKIKKNQLTLTDFLDQLRQVRRMGPLKELMSMIPGMGSIDMDGAEAEMPRIEAIICSMTPAERENPDLIDASRKRRIAAGSATQTAEVNQLLKQFKQMKKLMRSFAGGKGVAAPADVPAAGGMPFGMGGPPGRMRKRSFTKKRRRRRK